MSKRSHNSLSAKCVSSTIWAVGLIVVSALLFGVTIKRAHAITINMEYTDEGEPVPHDENPAWDPDGTILKAHFQRAKQIWEALLPGPEEYSFDFHWDDDIGETTLGLTTDLGIDTFVEINPNHNWFADPTPEVDSEFSFSQRLLQEIPVADQSANFPGTEPPGTLEVSFFGTGASGTPNATGQAGVDASNGPDLLSTIVHELGHVLGISGVEPGDYNIFPQHVGGLEDVLVLDNGGHLGGNPDSPGFLMCDSCGLPGRRRIPSATDVLVVAEDQGIENVHLERVGSISPGNWNEPLRWIGGAVPDITQDVYIRHGLGSITLDADAQAKNLLLANDATLHAESFRLTVASMLSFDGTLIVGTGGIIEADSITGDPTSLSAGSGSLVRFNQFVRAASSMATTFHVDGSLAIGYGAVEDPPVLFDSGPFTTWNIAEDLLVGQGRSVTVIISSGRNWSVNDSVIVGSGNGLLIVEGVLSVTDNLEIFGSKSSVSEVRVHTGTGANLDVFGEVNIGQFGHMTYVGAVADAGTYNIAGGAASISGGPPQTLELANGGSLTIDGGSVFLGTAFDVAGGIGDGAAGASLTFKGSALAGNTQIWNHSGQQGPSLVFGTRAGFGGHTRFENSANADSTNIHNDAVVDDQSGSGGRTTFAGSSHAGNATINNYGSPTFAPRENGATEFIDSATAGSATITNHPTNAHQVPNYLNTSRTSFFDTSTAGGATITNKGNVDGFWQGARTFFFEQSNAGDATIINEGGAWPGLFGGATIFYGDSTAGTADFFHKPGRSTTEFRDNSSAQNGTFVIETSPGVQAGVIGFFNNAKAGDAHFTIQPFCFAPSIFFENNSSAETADFTLADNSGGFLRFLADSSAGQADFDIGSTGNLQFFGRSTAGSANIRIRRSGSGLFQGDFSPNFSTTAAAATIAVEGAPFFNGPRGTLTFNAWSSAANSVITAEGGAANGARGGIVNFDSGAHGQNVTLILASGTAPGAFGGEAFFFRGSNPQNARVINHAGGWFDVSGNRGHIPKSTTGSIEGAGTFNLSGVELETGSLNTDTVVSGPIIDNPSLSLGGKLTKVGTGTLRLSGANTYTGLTTVNAGAVIANGSNVGGAEVKNGAALKGFGSLGGTVTVEAGGTLAPGDDLGNLTVGALDLLAGSILDIELGGTTQGSQYDQLTTTGALILAGTLRVSLANGFTPGAGLPFDILNWGSLAGVFSSISLPNLAELSWDTSQLYTTGTLIVVSAQLPGDFNFDGSVDAADYIVWRKGLGTTYTLDDYNDWQANFGATLGTGAATLPLSSAIPEPTSALLVLSFVAIGVWRHPGGRH
jgi:autotransporter-associated beta strand protein